MNNLLKKAITLLDIITTYPLFIFSLIIPRDKKLWIFVGWHKYGKSDIFADNTKYLFLYMSKSCHCAKAVWIAKDRKLAKILQEHGFNSYYENSLEGIWTSLRAGYTVLDAYLQRNNYRWSGRTKIIQLLHGKGMKKGGYAKEQFRIQDYIFGPSKFTLNLLPSSFTKSSKTYVAGYSRDDIFYKKQEGQEISLDQKTSKLIQDKIAINSKIILYAPTYRRGSKIFDLEKITEKNKMSSWLEKNNATLFINLHQKYRDQVKNTEHKDIFFFEESDIYPLLSYFNILITDYSSIFTDYLLLDKPIIFYPYDLETYAKNEEMNINYNENTPGAKVTNIDELIKELTKIINGEDIWKDKRRIIRKQYHEYFDGKTSERIISILEKEEKICLRE